MSFLGGRHDGLGPGMFTEAIERIIWMVLEAEPRCSGAPLPCSGCHKDLAPGQEQIRLRCRCIELAAVLGQARQRRRI